MEIKEIDVKNLKFYEKNPRRNEKAIEKVAESIRLFGFKVPVVVDKDNVIICGHTRVQACRRMGYKTVPCVIASDLNEEQIKAFRLVDNKTQEYSQWDMQLLNDELSGLQMDLGTFDFPSFDIKEEYTNMFDETDLDDFLREDDKGATFTDVNENQTGKTSTTPAPIEPAKAPQSVIESDLKQEQKSFVFTVIARDKAENDMLEEWFRNHHIMFSKGATV